TPFDRCAQCALPGGGVVRSGTQQVEAGPEPLEDLRGREHLDSTRGELEREWKAVDRAGDLCNGIVRLEVRIELPRALCEERDSVVERKRRDRILLLCTDVQAAPTRREHMRS